ncbi:hypothetical protein FKM95_000233 [Candidatus Tremblaya phenacola]|nr:hypothetical protein FKM95_000233 [Candidatus Tremblaya phenacola]
MKLNITRKILYAVWLLVFYFRSSPVQSFETNRNTSYTLFNKSPSLTHV